MTAVLIVTRSNGQRVRRYPFGPVQDLVSRRTGLPLHREGCPCPHEKCCSASVIATYLGTSERQITRWRTRGMMGTMADRVVTELGLRIEDLWDED